MSQHSTADEISAFLDQLSGEAEIHDFIDNLGQDLVASSILREAEFSPGIRHVQKIIPIRYPRHARRS